MLPKPSWSRIRSHLLTFNKDDLLKVIQDLYQLNNDNNEAFYNSLEGVFEDAIALIKKTGNPGMIEAFRPRIKRILANTSGIGWGFHDFLSDVYHAQYPSEG